MSDITTFDSTKERLLDLLRSIHNGKTQLPDFQRGWVWDDFHIRSLLASVSLSYPIGAVMMLETGNAEVRFKPRPIEGARPTQAPERLILDGQQRMTSLFQTLLLGTAVETRDAKQKSIKRWYYIDIARALDPDVDREDAIISIPEDKKVKNFRGEIIADYSTPEREYEAGYFPVNHADGNADWHYADWRSGFCAHVNYAPEKIRLFDRFEREIIKRIEQYQIPVIRLMKETPKEAVCQVFEKVNTGGVPLTVFELLTATYAVDDFNLREDWNRREKRLRSHKVLASLENTEFLQAVTLLATYDRDATSAVSCKRRDVLRLKREEYEQWADRAMTGFEEAAKLIHGLDIYAARDLPYRTQLVPLAAILAWLGTAAKADGIRGYLTRWYWCGVFGELYGSAVETRSAKDMVEVLRWLDGGEQLPGTIIEANFSKSRLLTLTSRSSAAYKGLFALLMGAGGLDFLSGQKITEQIYFDERIDIHHIFPKAHCIRQGISEKLCDSIINKTMISARTNRSIGGNDPSKYVPTLESRAKVEAGRMDEILASHVIDPAALRADDFTAFFAARERALLDRITAATGITIIDTATGENGEEESMEYQQNDGDEYNA